MIGNTCTNENVIIPFSITYENQEIIIQSIDDNSFKYAQTIKSIEISSNSKIHNIRKFAFYYSSIETVVIPPSVSELENGWCAFTPKLNNVIIMPNNQNYKNYDDKIVIGKSDKKVTNLIFLFS